MLESALGQAAPGLRYEILVVDNNSSDGTRELVEGLIRAGHSRIRYLFEPRQGRSHALNTGLPAIRGQYFAIADDDLLFPPTFLSAVMAAIRQHPAASCIGGRVLPRWQESPPGWLTRQHWSALALSDRGPKEIRADSRNPHCLLAGVYRTADVIAVGGYHPELGVSGTRIGGTEDADLFQRLYASGRHAIYAPAVFLYHKVQPSRITRAYHRRWHAGHGRSFALMRDPSVEGSSSRILGIPGHLFRSAARDVALWVGGLLRGNRDSAFMAELRLRFFAGFAKTRLRETMAGKRDDERPSAEAGRTLT